MSFPESHDLDLRRYEERCERYSLEMTTNDMLDVIAEDEDFTKAGLIEIIQMALSTGDIQEAVQDLYHDIYE